MQADLEESTTPLSVEMEAFFHAQAIDVTVKKTRYPFLNMLQTDDEDSLVVNFITFDRVFDELPDPIAAEITMLATDPLRTRLVLCADYSPSSCRTIAATFRETVHDVVRYTDFLDMHIRPDRICASLLEGGKDELNSESGLLYENDFVEPYARTMDGQTVPALRHLHQGWASGQGRRVSMVLAPAGLGKSKLTHILAKRIARKYDESGDAPKPPIPFLIPFGKYRTGTQSFTGLIHSRLNDDGVPRLRVEALQFLVTSGRVLFMLDGFDEMMEADPVTARANLARFVENVGSNGRILLTSRTLFYHAARDVLASLGDPELDESDIDLLELQPFSKAQAKEFLKRRLEHTNVKGRAMERVQTIVDAEQSHDIFGSPFFLAELVSLLGEGKFSITGFRDLGTVGFFVKAAFQRERKRQGHHFTDREQREFLEAVALDMLRTGAASYSMEDLQVFLAESLLESVEDPEAQGLLNNHFLDKFGNHRGGEATIKHQIWREHFQGSALAKLRSSKPELWASVLETRTLPEGVVRTCVRSLGSSLPELSPTNLAVGSDTRVRNQINLWLMRDTGGSPGPVRVASNLRRRSLTEMTFRNVAFAGSSFEEANLTGAYFEECDLTDVIWTSAVLTSTTFKNCTLDNSLRDAQNSSVTIEDVEYFGRELQLHLQQFEDLQSDDDIRTYATSLLRERLGKFVKSSGIDTSISWRAFLGGVRPADREFVVRILYRALRSEGIVTPARSVGGSQPPLILTYDADVRKEVLELIGAGDIGVKLDAVLSRIERRAR